MKRQDEPKKNEKEALIRRAYLISACLVLFAIAVAVKLVRAQYYETYKGKTWAEHAVEDHLMLDTVRAMRGNIYASDGSLLATSLPFYTLGFDPCVADSAYFTQNVGKLADSLAHFLRFNSSSYYKQLFTRYRRDSIQYVRLSKQMLDYNAKQRIEKWPFFKNKKMKGSKGLILQAENRRHRPLSPMADRTVGTLNTSTGHGLVGLEASFDKQLAGTDGIRWVEAISRDVRIPIGDEINVRPEPGYDIHTTLDINFQDVAESALKQALEKYQANFGCVIVMEVATGKIKAMSNLTRRAAGLYVDNRNYALTLGVDPGSTFKLATMMAVLEETGIDPDKVWVDTGKGRLVYRNITIEDAHTGGFGSLTASQVLEKSSNIGTHLLMQKYFYKNPDRYIYYLDKFRLRNRTGLHMAGESAPLIRDRKAKEWSPKTSLTYMSYGYEMRLAPIQILTLYNAVANRGYWVRPMIVDQVRNSSEIINSFEPYVDPNPICSERTALLLREMLEGVVQRGTAPYLKQSVFRMAGKTGTAQKIVNGRYQKSKGLRTSFVGFFPANRPKYSCFVLVDNALGGSSDLYAGEVAAPVFKQVADRIYAYDLDLHEPTRLKPAETAPRVAWSVKADEVSILAEALNLTAPPTIADSTGWLFAQTGTKGNTQWKTRKVEDTGVPDLRGMSLRDALYIMENKGYRVSFKGTGKVVTQSLEPGTTPSGQKSIMLSLK